MAGNACCPRAPETETHSSDQHRTKGRCSGTGPDLLRAMELRGKYHSLLVTPAQSGHQPWLCQGAGRELGTGQTPNRGPWASATPPTGSADLPSAASPIERKGIATTTARP